MNSRGEDADRAPEITRCAADLWMNHEEQAAAVDFSPGNATPASGTSPKSTAGDSVAMRFQGASVLLSSPVWSLAPG